MINAISLCSYVIAPAATLTEWASSESTRLIPPIGAFFLVKGPSLRGEQLNKENKMKKKSIRKTKSGNAVVVTINGASEIFSINLIKFVLEIPFENKNGELISEKVIRVKKLKSQIKYLQAIKSNQKAQA